MSAAMEEIRPRSSQPNEPQSPLGFAADYPETGRPNLDIGSNACYRSRPERQRIESAEEHREIPQITEERRPICT